MEPLAAFFSTVTPDERREIKVSVGSSASKRFFRSFEKIISDERSDFMPDGLREYIENETKEFNDDWSAKLLQESRTMEYQSDEFCHQDRGTDSCICTLFS